MYAKTQALVRLNAAINAIAAIVNLADSYEDLEEYFAGDDFASHYYKSIYDAGQTIALD